MDDATPDLGELAGLLRTRGRVRGNPVAISLFADQIPDAYAGKAVEPCAIVRQAMDLGEAVYVDADHHACLAGAWQAGFVDPPVEIRSGRYLADHTPFFTLDGAAAVKGGENVIPLGTLRAIGAAPLDAVPEGVAVDWIVVVCEPGTAASLGGVRVAIDGTPPRGAAGTSLCGDIFALPFHEPNVIISTGDVGGRMFNRVKASEMFVLIPMQWAHMIPVVLTGRPDLGNLLESIKPGYLAERERKRAARQPIPWDDEAQELLEQAPAEIREFAAPTLEEYAREHGHERITLEVMDAQMATVGMSLEDIRAMLDPPSHTSEVTDQVLDEPSEPPAASGAPIHASASVVIDAAPQEIWEVLVDAARWSEWYPDLRSIRAPGRLEAGAAFSFRTGPVSVKAEVDRADVARSLRFTGRSRGSVATYEFTLRPGATPCEVTLTQEMDGLAAKTMRPMLQRIADTSLPAWLEALRIRVEGSAG